MPAHVKPILIEGEVRAETRGLAIVVRGEGDALSVETDSVRAAFRAMPGRGHLRSLLPRLTGPLERAGLTILIRRRGREVARVEPGRGPNLAGRLLRVAPARVSLLNLIRP